MASNDCCSGCCSGCCCGPEVGQLGQQGEHPGAKYSKTFKTLGVTQIALGTASILFGTILLILSGLSKDYTYGVAWACPGIWGGVFFVAAGILGVKSATYPTQCMITAAMVLTIFAPLASIAVLSLGITGAAIASEYYYYYYGYTAYKDAQTAFHGFLAVIGFVEMIVSITHSSYCCAVNCCREAAVATTTQMYMNSIPTQGPVLTVANQHGGVPEYRYVVQGQANPGFNHGVIQVGGPGMPHQQIPGNQFVQQPGPVSTQNQPPPPQYTDKTVS